MCKEYPDTFARGILNEQYILDDFPDTALFTDFRDAERQDGYSELSINWVDDVYAVTMLSSKLLTRQYIFRHQRHKLLPDQENNV
jgi:hypothetical protein